MTTLSPSGASLVTNIAFLVLIFLVVQLVIERYGLVDTRNRALSRLITFAFMINIAILVFMIISYNYVQGKPGVPGPKGIRGPPGPTGNRAIDNMCTDSTTSQVRTLGTIRTRQLKRQI